MSEQREWGTDDIAEQIRKALNNALDGKEFGQLNRTISETVDSALGEARQQFERYRRRSDEPVGSQTAEWVEEDSPGGRAEEVWGRANAEAEAEEDRRGSDRTAGMGGQADGSRTEEAWRRGTRRPGDAGRYTYQMDETSDLMEEGGRDAGTTGGTVRGNGGTAAVPAAMKIRVNWRGRLSSILMSVVGGIGTVLFGLPALLFLCLVIMVNDSFGWGMTLFFAVLAGCFGVMLYSGVSRNRLLGRLKMYLNEIRRIGKPYCEVSRLGQAVGRAADSVRKDLMKILSLGMLPDARMDEKGTCLMLDQETFQQYQMAQESLRIRQEEERRAREKEEKTQTAGDSETGYGARNGKEGAGREVQRGEEGTGHGAQHGEGEDRTGREARRGGDETGHGTRSGKEGAGHGAQHGEGDAAVDAAIARGEEQMELLDEMRRTMPAGVMTEKLIRLDRVLGRLFETLRRYPDQLDELERFMEYYLPTTVKLVTAYKEFAAVEFPGDNINTAKQEIEKTMDTINDAFEKLLDDMYEDTAFDVMTDASVLQTILKREGLTEGDFE